MTQELRKLADATLLTEQWYSANFLDAKIGNGEDAAYIAAANPAAILELLDKLEKAEKELSFLNGDLLYWTERAVGKGNANSDIEEAWERYEAFQRAAMEASK